MPLTFEMADWDTPRKREQQKRKVSRQCEAHVLAFNIAKLLTFTRCRIQCKLLLFTLRLDLLCHAMLCALQPGHFVCHALHPTKDHLRTNQRPQQPRLSNVCISASRLTGQEERTELWTESNAWEAKDGYLHALAKRLRAHVHSLQLAMQLL